jgi:hypothetical protein
MAMWEPFSDIYGQFHSGCIKVGYYADFFQTNYEDLGVAIGGGNVLAVLTNPFIIAITALLFVLFAVKRSKKSLALLGAAWSYGIVYHFTLGVHKFEFDLMLENREMSFGPMIGFFVGMALITFVVLYVVFQSD